MLPTISVDRLGLVNRAPDYLPYEVKINCRIELQIVGDRDTVWQRLQLVGNGER
jgi:hypothetical protein